MDGNTDPDGSNLRTLLEVQFTYERMRTGRSFCVHLLAILGVPVWLEAIWPSLLPAEMRLFSLVLWAGILFIAMWLAVEEYLSHRTLIHRRSENQGVAAWRIKEPL